VKIARFVVCHTRSMANTDTLVKLKNFLNSKEGELLIAYLSDVLTANCCKNKEALEIKGFGECIQEIKVIPQKLENKYKE